MAPQWNLEGHPGQDRIFDKLRRTFYWPQMASDDTATVRSSISCTKNIVRFRKITNRLQSFQVTDPLSSVWIDIMEPLTKSLKGNRFLIVICDLFTYLSQAIPLQRIDSLSIAIEFTENCFFLYVAPTTVPSYNGSHFSSKLFQGACKIMFIMIPPEPTIPRRIGRPNETIESSWYASLLSIRLRTRFEHMRAVIYVRV